MRVAIDFDGTYSSNPAMWQSIVDILKANQVDVVCITARFPNVPLPPMPVPVYYTCGQMKWEFAQEKGIPVDIWIDDIPECIGGTGMEPGQVQQRRALVRQFFDQNFNAGPYPSLSNIP